MNQSRDSASIDLAHDAGKIAVKNLCIRLMISYLTNVGAAARDENCGDDAHGHAHTRILGRRRQTEHLADYAENDAAYQSNTQEYQNDN